MPCFSGAQLVTEKCFPPPSFREETVALHWEIVYFAKSVATHFCHTASKVWPVFATLPPYKWLWEVCDTKCRIPPSVEKKWSPVKKVTETHTGGGVSTIPWPFGSDYFCAKSRQIHSERRRKNGFCAIRCLQFGIHCYQLKCLMISFKQSEKFISV